MHEGSCHCGAVRLTLPSTPAVATECNCSVCRRIGGPWVYFEFGTVKIAGHPESTLSTSGVTEHYAGFTARLWVCHALGASEPRLAPSMA